MQYVCVLCVCVCVCVYRDNIFISYKNDAD